MLMACAHRDLRMIQRVISGGQTGVDRAALDVALELGLSCGGWCPHGRQAEDGPIAPRYPLQETPSADSAQRTEWNVRDSDGTLLLSRGELTGGTAWTVECAGRFAKPCLILDLAERPVPEAVRTWALDHQVRLLNVAGPRESRSPGIYAQAVPFLRAVLGGLP